MRIILAVLFLVTASVSLYSLPLMMGFQYSVGTYYFNFASTNQTYGTATMSALTEYSIPEESLTVFFDLYYARFSVGYTFISFPVNAVISNGTRIISGKPEVNPFHWSSLEITLLGKLPIQFNQDFNIWFGAGIEYSINLTFDINGNGTNDMYYGANDELDGRNMNDLYGVLAVGATLNLTESMALTPLFTFKYDFNHQWRSDAYILDPTGYNIPSDKLAAWKLDNFMTFMKFDLGIGLAIRL